MSTDASTNPPGSPGFRSARHLPAPGTVNYLMVCAVALVIILMVAVLEEGATCWAVLPVVIGVLGLVMRWSSAPLLVIFSLAAFELVLAPLRDYAFGRYSIGMSPVSTLILCGAVLAYAVGHYRLQGVAYQIVPPDSPRPGRRLPRAERRRLLREEATALHQRSPGLVTSQEIIRLVAMLPLWAGVAHLAWYLLPARWNLLRLPPAWWQLLLLVWILGLGSLVVSAVVRYLGLVRMTPEEAALYLQDVLWHETRREQRRIDRWLAWARLRERRKETP
jgi:hypothetical protein